MSLILVIMFLVGRLHSQSWMGTALAHSSILKSGECDTSTRPPIRDSNPNGDPIVDPKFAGTLRPLDYQPTCRTFQLAVHSVSVSPQKLPDSPEAQNSPGKKEKQSSPSATAGSPGHIFWVVPAFKVDYSKNFKPLTPKEKFQEWARGSYDPLGLSAGAAEAATLEHSSKDGFCGYGGGWSGYGKCFGSLELDANVSSFIGDFALTTLLHQDPRYFRSGEGSFGRRLWYAISRVFVTYNDTGHTVFYSSALTGTTVAAGISNLYYPKQDRSFGHTVSRVGIDLGNTALYNAAAEFWPDIHRKLHHIF